VQSYDELFKRYDIIVMPTIKYKAPRLPAVGFTVTGLAIIFSLNRWRLEDFMTGRALERPLLRYGG